MILSCQIPATPHTDLRPNKIRTVSGWHRQEIVAALKDATKLVAGQPQNMPPEPMTGPIYISVRIAWEKGRQLQDFEGAVGSLKPMVDGLEKAKWFVNDRQVVAMDVVQVLTQERQGWIEVTVHEGILDYLTHMAEAQGYEVVGGGDSTTVPAVS